MSRRIDPTQAIKWTVYSLLLINFGFYIQEDWVRASHTLKEQATALDWMREFATSIDELAWFVLLFMFELETYVISDSRWKGWVPPVVKGSRIICYLMLTHTLVAYTAELSKYQEMQPVTLASAHEQSIDSDSTARLNNLCTLNGQDLSYVYNLKYQSIDSENCSELSSASEFFWLNKDATLSDSKGWGLEHNLAWVDLLEACAWLIILFSIEFVVRLQDRGVTSGRSLKAATYTKFSFYSVLFGACVYWGWLSHWLYVWDEFLWVAGFAAIDMNLSNWRDEIEAEQQPA